MNTFLKRQASVYDLQDSLQGPEFDQRRIGELEVKHHFAPGVYAREALLPAGSCVVGKTHKTEHLNIISKGHCTVHTMGEIKEVHGPYTFVSVAGAKKAVYSHTDVIWTTIHVTEETDLKKIEKEVINDTAELEYQQIKRLEQ